MWFLAPPKHCERLPWAAAVEATGDPAFGLEVSRHVLPTTFHALGQAFLASATLRDALDLETIKSYNRKATGEKYLINPSL